MNDFDDESPREAEIARRLLRSARLDAPRASARSRALDAGLGEIESRTKRRPVLWAATSMTAALGLAAAATLLLGRSQPREPVVVAEAPSAKAPASAGLPKALPPCPEVVVARGSQLLIEDWEQNDLRLLASDGRSGSWTAYDDGTAKGQSPAESSLLPSLIPGRRQGSRRALHVTAGKLSDWGITVGADLATGACYDATAYGGVEFFAKGKGRLQVGLEMIDVQQLKFGGLCAKDCYNTHRKSVELTGGWQRVTARWEELRQLESAGKLAFNPRRIRRVEFRFRAEDTPFDVWIDDLAFTPR